MLHCVANHIFAEIPGEALGVSKDMIASVVVHVSGRAFSIKTINAGTVHGVVTVAQGWKFFKMKSGNECHFKYHGSNDAGQCARVH